DLEQAEFGAQHSPRAFQGNERFDEHADLRRQHDSVPPDNLRNLVQRSADVELFQGLAGVVFYKISNVVSQCGIVQIRWNRADALNENCQQHDVSVDNREQHLLDVLPESLFNSAYHAKVE